MEGLVLVASTPARSLTRTLSYLEESEPDVLVFPEEHAEQDDAVLSPLLYFPAWHELQLVPETYWPEGQVIV